MKLLRRTACSSVGLPPSGPMVCSLRIILPTVWPRVCSMKAK